MIRKGVDMAMRLMGEQFVTGVNIAKRWRTPASWKIKVSATRPATCWAKRPDRRRRAGLHGLFTSRRSTPSVKRPTVAVFMGPGISIKLSALHPRYSRAQVRPMRWKNSTRA